MDQSSMDQNAMDHSSTDHASLKAAGWTPVEPVGFSGAIGSFWLSGSGLVVETTVGFIAEPSHSNGYLDIVHGGALMTFADIALGLGVVNAIGRSSRSVTASLQTQFVAAGHIGDFITCRPEIIRQSASLVFVRGLLCVGEKTIASAEGIWKILQPR
jgi:acyl-coenzyme A thioesterase PaaI-like protein